MKKFFVTMLLMVTTMTMMAVPAKKGVWKTLKLENGTEVRAQLVGDEFGHLWLAEDGKAYAAQGDSEIYKQIEKTTVANRAKARRAKANAKRVQKRTFGHPSTILGDKKAIILLVNFKDKKFNASHDNALYQRIANEPNFSEGNFKGSMADYFKAQSRDKFTLDFDVVGPLTVSKNASYYGGNDSGGNDMHAGEMICEAVELAKEEVSDWTSYDWDGDGYIDQVYVVYAGQGEADGGSASTIWPHAFDLYSAKAYDDGTGPVEVGTNLYVNSYACGSELNGSNALCGIGTMCHEYSHCLGYPDFYDIDYGEKNNNIPGPGMGSWDLMDAGSYNGDGFQPAGYTSYERWFAGWEEPIELKAEDVEVRNMKSLQSGGEFYIIYNDKNANEYYMLENRQLDGWDASLPDAGLLILHCDYDAQVWENNAPNDDTNHQRFIPVTANGKYTYNQWSGYYDDAELFPYSSVNAFNKDFKTTEKIAKKAAQFFTKTSNGTYWMNGSVEAITKNSDKTISFNYVADYAGNGGGNGGGTQGNDDDKPVVEGALFYESFDQCNGTGGNDGLWSGSIAVGTFVADNDGWTANENKLSAANKCAKFGTSSTAGVATTPAIALNGTTTMTFKAGAWDTTSDQTTLKLTVDGGSVEPATVEMQRGAFTDYTVNVTGNGSVKVTFEVVVTGKQKGRFFLDEVIVVDNTKTAIENINTHKTTTNKIYTIDGRFVGTDPDLLPRGLYIINGKKIVK